MFTKSRLKSFWCHPSFYTLNLGTFKHSKITTMYRINMHNSLKSYSDHQMEPILFRNRMETENPKQVGRFSVCYFFKVSGAACFKFPWGGDAPQYYWEISILKCLGPQEAPIFITHGSESSKYFHLFTVKQNT